MSLFGRHNHIFIRSTKWRQHVTLGGITKERLSWVEGILRLDPVCGNCGGGNSLSVQKLHSVDINKWTFPRCKACSPPCYTHTHTHTHTRTCAPHAYTHHMCVLTPSLPDSLCGNVILVFLLDCRQCHIPTAGITATLLHTYNAVQACHSELSPSEFGHQRHDGVVDDDEYADAVLEYSNNDTLRWCEHGALTVRSILAILRKFDGRLFSFHSHDVSKPVALVTAPNY